MTLLWTVPALPLLGFLVLSLAGGRLGRFGTSVVGVGSVAASAVMAFAAAASYVASPPAGGRFVQTLWSWLRVGGLDVSVSLVLDPLSLVMITVVTGVGSLILLYSTEFMEGREGYARFFAYMDLFVASMLILVLAGDLLFLYLGWEGVGMCSFLLIGFWYEDPANGRAATKAFLVTRIGDAAMAVGLFLLVFELGTLDVARVLDGSGAWAQGSGVAVAAAALLLAGAVGKSAQLPLQVWLPDAMAGPTPVSALIHAATMVTAGVYLIARMHPLFLQAPVVLDLVALVGAATLLAAGLAALAQHDIKRVLAWSTVSQIGYMFLALGVGAWSAAVFHFMTHAYFKALLFLAAGAVILARGGEHDVLKMGGLRRELPVTFWTFVAGSASLAALPLVTAGFFSKDLILWRAWEATGTPNGLWLAGLLGSLLTGLYIFRVVFLVFLGDGPAVERKPGWRIRLPLVVLAVLAVVGGWVEMPQTLGGVHVLSSFLDGLFPAAAAHGDASDELFVQALAALVVLVGIGLAWRWFGSTASRERRPAAGTSRASGAGQGTGHSAAGRVPLVPAALDRLWAGGWGFDTLYDRLVVRPWLSLARAWRGDPVDRPYDGLAAAARTAWSSLRVTQTGGVRTYLTGLALGAVFILALVLVL